MEDKTSHMRVAYAPSYRPFVAPEAPAHPYIQRAPSYPPQANPYGRFASPTECRPRRVAPLAPLPKTTTTPPRISDAAPWAAGSAWLVLGALAVAVAFACGFSFANKSLPGSLQATAPLGSGSLEATHGELTNRQMQAQEAEIPQAEAQIAYANVVPARRAVAARVESELNTASPAPVALTADMMDP